MDTSFVDFVRWIGGGAKAAVALDVSEATISRYRNGQPVPVPKAKRIEVISHGMFRAANILGLASGVGLPSQESRDAA